MILSLINVLRTQIIADSGHVSVSMNKHHKVTSGPEEGEVSTLYF